jgi:two-component system, OmpR family, sensor kinase
VNFELLTQGFAILLDLQGTVVSLLYDSFDLDEERVVGVSFTRLLDRESLTKALNFLVQLRTEGAAFDWELVLRIGAAVEVLHFAGVVVQESILVIGSKDRGEINDLYRGMVEINNEQMNALRVAIKEKTEAARDRTNRDEAVYDELSRVNNTLVNLQRELAKKNAELSRLNELKNQFIGMAAHDLRNPLAAIMTYSEFVIDEIGPELGEEYLEFLQIIQNSSTFMLGMINDLLDVSIIESGKLDLNLEAVDLCALAERNVALNSALAQKKDIALSFEAPVEPLPMMLLDAPKIEQVLNNLISNAIKYSYPDSHVRVSLERGDGGVLLSVTDEGQGIPEAEMDKLFRYFGRTSVQTTGGERSTGLGLAIARNIVEGHGGRIWAESVVGQGSTFYVCLSAY